MTPSGGRKAAWPLILVAALSFVPGLGLFFAAAGLSWALLGARPRAKLAAGISIAGAVANIGAAVAYMAWLQRDPTMVNAQAFVARKNLLEVIVELEAYGARMGHYPPDLETLNGKPIPVRFLNITDLTAGFLRARSFPYERRSDGTYDVFGLGPDGERYTADDVRALVPDSVQAPGYRPGP